MEYKIFYVPKFLARMHILLVFSKKYKLAVIHLDRSSQKNPEVNKSLIKNRLSYVRSNFLLYQVGLQDSCYNFYKAY